MTLDGIDGSGKSTQLALIMQHRNDVVHFHGRPQRIVKKRKASAAQIANPMARPRHGWIASLTISALIVVEYWIAALHNIFLAPEKLVIFERSFVDVRLSPERYGLSPRLAKLVFACAPHKLIDRHIILVAPADVLLARKQELLPKTIETIMVEIEHFAAANPRCHILNTATNTVEEVQTKLISLIK